MKTIVCNLIDDFSMDNHAKELIQMNVVKLQYSIFFI